VTAPAEYWDQSYPPSVLHPGPPDPRITTLVPNTGSAAAGAILVTVNGSNFEADSVIEIAQQAKATTFVSPTVLTTSYDPTVAGTVQFTVRNVSGQESNSVPFTVAALVADDVSAMTVAGAEQFIADHPDLLAELYAFELAGKARATLLAWLKTLLDEETARAAEDDD
jgi:IPT/TIG domain